MDEKIMVTCTDTGKKTKADILHKSDKLMKVVIPGAFITLMFSRTDTKKPYVANSAGLEFTTMGEIL